MIIIIIIDIRPHCSRKNSEKNSILTYLMDDVPWLEKREMHIRVIPNKMSYFNL